MCTAKVDHIIMLETGSSICMNSINLKTILLNAQPIGVRAENNVKLIQTLRASAFRLYARYLCSRDALGLKAARDDRVSCIQAFRLSARASKGILQSSFV